METEDNKSIFKCNYCEKTFNRITYRTKHAKRVHKKTAQGEDILETTFTCVLCDKVYDYKTNLQRHIDTVHFSNEMECNICSYKTNRKCSLKRHIIKVHTRNSTLRNHKKFKCAHCNLAFSTIKTLRFHEKKKHDILRFVKHKISRKCPLCPFRSNKNKKDEINSHFKEKHDLLIKQEKYNFQNLQEFNDWKRQVEVNTNASFIKAKYSTSMISYYFCHRRGQFKSRGKNRRHIKIMGSCKINGHCPSEIRAKLNEDGKISVVYVSNHIGHKNELKFIRLRPEDRKAVASQILSKAPHNEILKKIRNSLSHQELHRIHLLNKKDIINIEKSFNLNAEAEKHPFDPVSIEAWVNDLKSCADTSLLVYKPQGRYDPTLPQLKSDDFVLIFMKESQKEMLKSFGHNTICIDGTHGVNNYNFQLYTLLTIDETREGFPCAFMFSNRGDITVLSLFFNSIKGVVGDIETEVFMSDMEETFYSAWSKVMGPAKLRLFCTWHVLKSWRSNLNKIKNKTRKEEVYKILKTLLYELDSLTFHKLLEAAIKNLENDVETEEYGKYFKDHYVKNESFKHWAYAYRIHAGINTNMSLENFNRVLKYCYLRGKKVQRLDKTLCAVLNLVKDKLFDYIIKMEKGKLVTKLQILRNRHKKALTFDTSNILEDGESKWQVMSSTGTELYCVKKVQNCKNCNLLCIHCHSCFHEFMCTCLDNSIKNNMCKHIHAVARILPFEEEMLPVDDCEEKRLEMDVDEAGDKQNIKAAILSEVSADTQEEEEVQENRLRHLFEEIIQNAKSKTQKEFVEKKLKETLTTVQAIGSTAELPIEKTCRTQIRRKIEPQRRFFSLKKGHKKKEQRSFTNEERGKISLELLGSDKGEQMDN